MNQRRAIAAPAALAVLALGLASCDGQGTRPPPAAGPAARAAAVVQALGQAPGVVAETVVVLEEPGHPKVSFHVHWWCAPDGRLKVVATKENVDFASALLAPDGHYRALLPREHLGSEGIVPAPDGHTLTLAQAIRLAGAQLRDGPLPPGAAFRDGPDAGTVLFPLFAGVSAQATLDAHADQVRTLRWLAADGTVLLTLTCDRYEAVDDQLIRPTIDHVALHDGTRATILLPHLRSVPVISDAGLSLPLPASTTLVPLDDFLDHLAHVGD